ELVSLENAMVSKDKIRANVGAMQHSMQNTSTNLEIHSENLQAAESRIYDVDVFSEMTNFVRNHILTQSAVAMLSQANSLPRMAMQLLCSLRATHRTSRLPGRAASAVRLFVWRVRPSLTGHGAERILPNGGHGFGQRVETRAVHEVPAWRSERVGRSRAPPAGREPAGRGRAPQRPLQEKRRGIAGEAC
ncbi:hypothetical protein DQK91_22290, partial [Oceanidesulfovibrio marinus]